MKEWVRLMKVELDFSKEGKNSVVTGQFLSCFQFESVNLKHFLWSGLFSISRYMMLVSSKVVSTKKQQETLPKEDEKHCLQYNAVKICLECVVRGERRLPAQMEKGIKYSTAHRHADLPFIFHWGPNGRVYYPMWTRKYWELGDMSMLSNGSWLHLIESWTSETIYRHTRDTQFAPSLAV